MAIGTDIGPTAGVCPGTSIQYVSGTAASSVLFSAGGLFSVPLSFCVVSRYTVAGNNNQGEAIVQGVDRRCGCRQAVRSHRSSGQCDQATCDSLLLCSPVPHLLSPEKPRLLNRHRKCLRL